jgi:Gamma-glutamyl cyclotransferase, AIG2-like
MDRHALPKIVDQDPPTRRFIVVVCRTSFAAYDRSRYQSVNWTGALLRARPQPAGHQGADRRAPEAASPTVMTYFFFGTLMDLDVLAAVLDRPLTGGELSQAWLRGYRRVRAATASYPVLVPATGLVVAGVLFHPQSTRDEVRIRHFEDGDYIDRRSMVRLRGGRQLPARVFFSLEALGSTDDPWDLAEWAHEHKAAFLEQCREWMRDCPECEADATVDLGLEAKVAGWRRRPPGR